MDFEVDYLETSFWDRCAYGVEMKASSTTSHRTQYHRSCRLQILALRMSLTLDTWRPTALPSPMQKAVSPCPNVMCFYWIFVNRGKVLSDLINGWRTGYSRDVAEG